MVEKHTKEENILDARDHIETSMRNLRIDGILFSVIECLFQKSMPFPVSEQDQYALFSRVNEHLVDHLKELRAAWEELEKLQTAP